LPALFLAQHRSLEDYQHQQTYVPAKKIGLTGRFPGAIYDVLI
jgi:hypothetical protein